MKLSFRKKLIVPLVVSWICLWAVTITALFHTKSLRLHERQFALKSTNELALSIAKDYASLAAAGQLSLEEAQAQAMARIKSLRYGKDGYITVISSHPTVLMHPIKPELDGKDATNMHDPKGNYLFRDMAAIAKSTGAGWVEYVWPKPGHPDQQQVFPKGSYVLTFKPWDWSFVTGVYLDDLTDALINDFWDAFIALTIIGLALNGSIFLVIRSVERSVGGDPDHAAEVAHRITAGNLSQPVLTKAGDSSSMLFAMKTMQDSLLSIVSKVRAGTDSIADASQEIAAGNLDLSSRTEQQAASLEETASSVDELTSTVKQNADNARQANQLALEASSIAGKGGAVVSEVVGTMAAINESAKKIVDIIAVIDGIAFQTNILALNAAVEAARAGEQGRGFAVVATEVRTLAQRSAAAAKEIKALIGDSAGKVEAGTQLVDQAGATMLEVVSSVKRVSDLIAEIAAASEEQTTGIEQVNQAIGQMDQATQQNAALVEEAAAASAALQKQAAEVAAAVSVFKLTRESNTGASSTMRDPRKTAAPLPSMPDRTIDRAQRPALPPATAAHDWEEF